MTTQYAVMMVTTSTDSWQSLVAACRALSVACAIEQIHSGEDALQIIIDGFNTDCGPDLVIIDIQLLGDAGYTVLHHVRADPMLRRLAVILMADIITDRDREQGRMAHQFLTKPGPGGTWHQIASAIARELARGQVVGMSRGAHGRKRASRIGIVHVAGDEVDRERFYQAFTLSELGCELRGLGSASEVLLYLNRIEPYAQAFRPRLIVLDLSSPRVNGRSVLTMIKTTGRFASIPVIMLLPAAQIAEATIYHPLGAVECLAKPDDLHALAQLIASFSHWLVGSSTGLSTRR